MKDKEKQIFDKYGNYDFPTDIKQEGLNSATTQIEEMAKMIDDRLIEARGWLGSMNRGKGYWIAQKLVEHYQPKLPENSVVLTEEEAERFRGQTINIAKVKAQARKETAKEILERGKYCMPSGLRDWIKERYGVEVEE